MTEPEPVIQVHGVGYIVASLSVPGAFRLVRDQDCTCPAGVNGVRCRHLRAVTEFCREQSARHRRPVAPPHFAALCD